MATNQRQPLKEVTRQLGCRANDKDQLLLNKAAELDKRDRNKFILLAAVSAARKLLKEHGIDEESLYREAGSGRRRKDVAA